MQKNIPCNACVPARRVGYIAGSVRERGREPTLPAPDPGSRFDAPYDPAVIRMTSDRVLFVSTVSATTSSASATAMM